MEPALTGSGFKAWWTADHRDGQGNLISRGVSIQPPIMPKDVSITILFRFVKSVIYCDLLAAYHSRRVAYAEANRRKKIPEHYRTGEHSPDNIIQAIIANAKLILFGGK